MANQEFLASFGVEIDESGVSRLQAVLEENRALPTVLMPHLVYLVTIFFITGLALSRPAGVTVENLRPDTEAKRLFSVKSDRGVHPPCSLRTPL